MAPRTILWWRLDRPGHETALGDTLYRYESGGGAFAAELTVDEAGMVTRYPGFAEVEPA